MANVDKYTLDQVIEAIRGSRGIKATIQRRLGCGSRNTVDSYLNRYATAMQAYRDEVEAVGDIAESLIVDDMIRNRSIETAKWYAANKLKDRGYGTRNEISGPNGGPIKTKNVTELSDEELAHIAARGGGRVAEA